MKATAAEIYKRQNKVVHRGFSEMGLTYDDFKSDMEPLFSDIAGRHATGISQLTLGERDTLIKHLNTRGCKLFRPVVPAGLRDWRKGDPDKAAIFGQRPVKISDAKSPMVHKIGAILADMKLPWTYVDAIAKSRYKVDILEWCKEYQIEAIMKMMIYHQNRNGGPK